MSLKINQKELTLLRHLNGGVTRAHVFKSGLYPVAVSFEAANGGWVTLLAREVELSSRFEVFPVAISEGLYEGEPEQEIMTPELAHGCIVSVLTKAEWDVPSTPEDKEAMLGDAQGATTQYEGKPSDVPPGELNFAILDAGVELRSMQGRAFLVATSMFPLALYVSNCEFSERVPDGAYDRLSVR